MIVCRLTLLFAALLSSVPGYSQGIYPEFAPIPRNLTPLEAAVWQPMPPAGTPPPSGPVRCVPEYDPMEGLQVSWEGSVSWRAILAQIIREITTPDAGGIAYVAVDDAFDESNAISTLQSYGVDLSKVVFIRTITDTIWCRDYGPRYIFEGGCRAIIDHVYNRPRPNDDQFPFVFADIKNHAIYGIPLIHGGGNFHLDGLNRGYATRLINNENPNLNENQIKQLWMEYQNLSVHLFDPFPINVDSTQHLDMWMQVVADDIVVISDWPEQSGSVHDNICDSAAALMAARGYTVYRTPAKRTSSIHYTYTNVVMFNNVVLIPSYTNALVSQYNEPALEVWRQACPGKRIVQINSEAIVSAAGVLHCIVMHIPKPLRGSNPSAYLKSPNGGEAFRSRQQITINWISDDDVGVSSVDLHLSLDGGATWKPIANGLPDTGSYVWSVPPIRTLKGKIRVTVRDGSGNVGSDESDLLFSINGAGLSRLGRG